VSTEIFQGGRRQRKKDRKLAKNTENSKIALFSLFRGGNGKKTEK